MSAEETPGDIFVHFSNIEMEGRKSLKTGEQVEVEVEVEGPFPPLLEVEGCRYAASVARAVR